MNATGDIDRELQLTQRDFSRKWKSNNQNVEKCFLQFCIKNVAVIYSIELIEIFLMKKSYVYVYIFETQES